MIECIALRRFSLSGAMFEQGQTVFLPECQFNDLAMCGLVGRKEIKPKRKRG
jgi:hypothetical protein